MPEEITPAVFAHLVELAALELTPAESEYLRQQLNNQLQAIHELEHIPVPAEIPPAAHGVPFGPAIRPPLRPDEPRPAAPPAAILQQAPETEDGYFVVPDIPHTEV